MQKKKNYRYTVSRAKILGNSEIFVKSGSDINLTCVAQHSPAPPSFIYWYKEGRVINYSQRGGISVLTERKTRTSKLVISKAMAADSGNYTCIPSSSGKLRIFSFVSNSTRNETISLPQSSLQEAPLAESYAYFGIVNIFCRCATRKMDFICCLVCKSDCVSANFPTTIASNATHRRKP